MNEKQERSETESCICRREFLLGGVKVSLSFLALEAFGLSSLVGHAAEVFTEGGVKPIRRPFGQTTLNGVPTVDDSLNVIVAYLAQYTPPAETFPDSSSWKATYDLIGWTGSPRNSKNFFRSNDLLGHLAFTRRASGAGVAYDLDYLNRLNGFDSALKATMQCSADRLPRLIEWKMDFEKSRATGTPEARALAHATLSEQGRHRDGVLEMTSSVNKRRIKTGRPVVPQWALIDALRMAKASPAEPLAAVEFDFLHNLTSYRPRQRVAPIGTLNISLDGKNYVLHGFLQKGVATQPTHYWVDEQGRTLLITEGMLALGLNKLEA